MGKFSDLPRFLLNDYFDEALSTGTTRTVSSSATAIQGSYLHGGRSSTVVDGGYWTKMWVKIDTIANEKAPYPGYTEYKFKVDGNIRVEDNFEFELGSLLTLPASANGTFDAGSEVYFKKGSYIYEWLVKNSTDYKNFFNTNKMWMYFGRIYPLTGEDTKYRIIFDGMKNFAINALPLHQRSDNLKEFMRLYFDKVFHEIYNMTKNVSSLTDAREIDTNWIEYLAKNYNIEIDEYFSGMPLREWVENIVYLLKKKGTYSSIFVIWKTLLENTLNNLNIYDRWHSALIEGDVPLGSFLDVLHQMEYGIEPEGCAGSYWYQKYLTLAGSVFHTQNNSTAVWDIYHEMFSKNIIVQCYNSDKERVWPLSIVAINTGLVRVTFSSALTGYALLLRKGNYLHKQDVELISWNLDHLLERWNINHMLDQKIVLSQFQGVTFSQILPDLINLQDSNVMNIEFGVGTAGYGMVQAVGVYGFLQAVASTTWTINHAKGQYVFVQAFDNDDDMLQPNSITLTDTDSGTVILTFAEAVAGYILVKLSEDTTTLPEYDELDMILSTHYRVEVDLSCEPLDDGETTPSILSETTIDRLVANWELMRPVTRYSHYHELIAPITDFSGNYTPLYGNRRNINEKYVDLNGELQEHTIIHSEPYGYSASLNTKYVTSAGELLPKIDSNTMVHTQYINDDTWLVTHSLSATDWIVQCYDDDDYRIWPHTIHSIGTDRVELLFEDAVNGHVVFAEVTPPSGVAYTQSIASSAWDVTHEMGAKETLIQWDDSFSHTKIMPSGAVLEGINDIRVLWGEPINGTNLLFQYDIVYPHVSENTQWIINHNLGTDTIIAQFFDDDDKMIEPLSLYLDNRNKATATFSTAVAGYVVINGVNKSITEQDVINSITGGTWLIGQGVSGSNYDPLTTKSVESFLASGSTLDINSDDDYFYIDFEVNNIINDGEDWDITEALILNVEGDPKFYSYFSPIHKPADVWFNMHFRIQRGQN